MIYVCIPAHDEARTIGLVLWKVRTVMAEFGRDYEVLVLDDASTDGTSEVVRRYESSLPVRLVRSEERLGYGPAVERLLREAVERAPYPKRDSAVVLQADLTEDPADLVDLVKTLEGGADIVAGVEERAVPDAPRPVRWARWLAPRLMGRGHRSAPVSDPLSGLRVYRIVVLKKALRDVDDSLLRTEGRWAANVELLRVLAPHARRIEEVPMAVRHRLRTRESRFRLLGSLRGLLRFRREAWKGVAAAALLIPLLLSAPGDLAAQSNGHGEGAAAEVVTDPTALPAPFGPGERLTYKVKLGPAEVGEAYMEVGDIQAVRGFPSYHLRLGMKASAFFGAAKLDDTYESWLDTRMLVSRRFIRDVHQLNYKSRRIFEIYPEEERWERVDADKGGKTGSLLTLDEIAFVYFIRTLPLEVGAEYEFNRYFKEDGNPVKVKVLRKETVETPVGTFETVVVQPIIRTDGLFSEGGEAEVYFTADEHKHLVYLRTKIPVIGSLTLHLETLEEGVPLNPLSR